MWWRRPPRGGAVGERRQGWAAQQLGGGVIWTVWVPLVWLNTRSTSRENWHCGCQGTGKRVPCSWFYPLPESECVSDSALTSSQPSVHQSSHYLYTCRQTEHTRQPQTSPQEDELRPRWYQGYATTRRITGEGEIATQVPSPASHRPPGTTIKAMHAEK